MSRPRAETEGIRVEVDARFIPEQSSAVRSYWFFAYTVRITNHGDQPARLTHRHWIIRDATGETSEVRGPGVVGRTPRLEPGQFFEYTSACPLDTPFGSMRGSYTMVRDDGSQFDAEVPEFALQQPHGLN